MCVFFLTYLKKRISGVQVLVVLDSLNTKYINMKYALWYYIQFETRYLSSLWIFCWSPKFKNDFLFVVTVFLLWAALMYLRWLCGVGGTGLIPFSYGEGPGTLRALLTLFLLPDLWKKHKPKAAFGAPSQDTALTCRGERDEGAPSPKCEFVFQLQNPHDAVTSKILYRVPAGTGYLYPCILVIKLFSH